MPEDTPTIRERAYFLRGQIKANRERCAQLGSTIDSLMAAIDASQRQIKADEAELRSLRDAHDAEMADEAGAA